jgi:CubicO group peptidase (beta-lactamase class C family)
MKRAWLVALLGLALIGPVAAQEAPAWPDLQGPWIEVTPDQVGLDAARLEAAAARAAQQPRVRCLLVARHGRLAFERYAPGNGPETLFDVRSVTKSVVSMLTGIAIRDGILPGPEASIAAYLSPRWRVDSQDAAVQVRHLLTMTSGFAWDESTTSGYNTWVTSPDQVQYVLDRPHAAAPGQAWAYNSGAVHLLGVVLEAAAHRPLPDLAAERLFQPLGITDAAWEPLATGTVNGGAGLDLRGRDLLKLGQLTLQHGWSGARSVVPEPWITETTRPGFLWRTSFGPLRSIGYGSLWWTADDDPPAYLAWGYGGQFIYVVPSLDLVVVATTDWVRLTEITPDDLEAHVLGVIVDGVLPAVLDRPVTGATP